MSNENNNILKIDLDIKLKKDVMIHLIERLNFFIKVDFLESKDIIRIELIKKQTYGCLIYLDPGTFKLSFDKLVIMQLLFGSDYKKETCSLLNYHAYKYNYANRLFTVKRYSSGKIIKAKIMNVTNTIKSKLDSHP